MKKLFKPIIILLIIVVGGILLIKPIVNNISYGIDLKGGFEILYRVEPLEKDGVIDQDALVKSYEAILDRIDTLGVSEPVISIEGDNLIRVQLPGVSNEKEARERISTTAVLTFRDINDNLLMTSEVLAKGGARAEVNPQLPGTYLVTLNINKTSLDELAELNNDSTNKTFNFISFINAVNENYYSSREMVVSSVKALNKEGIDTEIFFKLFCFCSLERTSI